MNAYCSQDTIETQQDESVKPDTTTAEPLAPPPRPDTAASAIGATPDYFSVAHAGGGGSHLSFEANPFEHSFASGGGAATRGDQTPGGTKLPSVASLTSPSGLLGGTTPNFWGGLRSGPLSPAMLSGPAKDDYFGDHHLRGAGFVTPNESSLRSGLTPGGGGSMFPEPSPNTQNLFNSLAGGVATPSTLEFQRTALAAAASQRKIPHTQPHITSQPQGNGLDVKPPTGQFDQSHEANDAANGLYLLAQAQAPPQNGVQPSHYAMAPQIPVHGHPGQMMQMGGQSNEASPHMSNHHHSISTTSGRGVSEMSGQSDDNEQPHRPNTRGKGKRSSTQINQTNGRVKTETPSKGPASKRSKGNNGHAMEPEPQSEEEPDMSKDEYNANGKKMTDEEKRKNFLERNR
jgi:ATF/CREB family transcription factor